MLAVTCSLSNSPLHNLIGILIFVAEDPLPTLVGLLILDSVPGATVVGIMLETVSYLNVVIDEANCLQTLD